MGHAVYSELGGDAGAPRAGPNVDLVAPDVCMTSSQNLQLREEDLLLFPCPIDQTPFFPSLSVFSRQPLRHGGYPVLFQTKQTLQPLMAFCSFYQSCCRIPDSIHASISFQGRNDLAYKVALGRCFPFLLDPALLLGPFSIWLLPLQLLCTSALKSSSPKHRLPLGITSGPRQIHQNWEMVSAP